MNARTSIFQRLIGATAVASVLVAGATVMLAARPPQADAALPAPRPAVTDVAPATTAPSTTAPSTPAPRTSAPAAETMPAGDPAVQVLQRRLAELGYDVGQPDGRWGERTSQSVMAFQKVEGLARTGTAGPEVTQALAKATPPHSLVPNGEATRVEIDLRRQVLLYWEDGRLTRVLPVSTGSGRRYCVDGRCDIAVTPKGSYHVGRKVAGPDNGPLGTLYYPLYFNGGIAIHGAPSVPASPASHGCARIPMYAAASFFSQVHAGTAVYVL